MKNKRFINIKDLSLIAIFAVVLFLQEEILSALPNIQLTIFLLIFYSKTLGCKRTIFIVFVYYALDVVFMGFLSPLYIVFQLIGWLLIPILMNTVFKKVNNFVLLSLIAVLFAFLYCWILIIPGCLLFEISVKNYFLMDLSFELLLAISSFVSTFVLYLPLKRAFKNTVL